MTFSQALGVILRERRVGLGLTQAEGAVSFGTVQSTMSRWETGLAMPGLDTVVRTLGVDDTIRLLQLVEERYPELAPVGGRVVFSAGSDTVLSPAALAKLLRRYAGS